MAQCSPFYSPWNWSLTQEHILPRSALVVWACVYAGESGKKQGLVGEKGLEQLLPTIIFFLIQVKKHILNMNFSTEINCAGCTFNSPKRCTGA